MQTQNITLDFCLNDYKTVTVKQGDKDSRNLIITCTDNGSVYKLNSSTQECNVKMNTPDNRAIFNTATINSDGTISMTFTESMVYANGTGKLEIQIIEQSTKRTLSTMILTVVIVGNVYPDGKVIASDEFSALTEALLSINDSINEAEKAIDRIEVLESTVERAEVNRINAESERQSNEENRQTNTATAIANAEEATAAANTATTNANNATETANTATENAIEATNNAVNATTNANEAAENAIDATQNAIQATNDIRSLEEQVTAAETLRQEQEAIRQENEEKRQTDTITAINNANTATVRANEAANAAEAALDKKADAIVQTLSGTTAVATDSAKAGLHGLRLLGKIEQETTTGAQLFDVDDVFTVNSSFTIDDDGWISLTYDNSNENSTRYFNYYTNPSELLTADTTYMVVVEVKSISGFGLHPVSIDTDDGATMSQFTGAKYITGTGTHCLSCKTKSDLSDSIVMLRSFVSVAAGVSGSIKFRLSVLADTTVTADTFVYEKFTGGIASPNPSYPQELVSVGNEGSVEVGVIGKNLLENTLEAQTTYGLTIKKSDDGVLNITGTTTAAVTCYIFNDAVNPIHNDKGVFIKGAKSINGLRYMAKVSNGEKVIYSVIGTEGLYIAAGYNIYEVYIQQLTTGTTVSAEIEPQILVGDADSTYEPYKAKQSLTAQTPNGLLGIKVTDASLATYTDEDGQMWCADEVDFERGVYVQRVLTKVYDGSDDEVLEMETTNTDGVYRLRFATDAYKTVSNDAKAHILCSHYQNVPAGANGTWTCFEGISISTIGYVHIYDAERPSSDVTEWKEFLSTNPITVAYILATPIETPLSDEELAAYMALHSNYPTTTVISDAHAEVKYAVDTETYINNNYVPKATYLALEERVSALEAQAVSV